MGTTLTGTTPQDTYDSLIKVTDNGPLSGTAKYLSDGLGNDSALALSTSRVGIGTTDPAHKFTISSTTDADLMSIVSSASANATILRFGIDGNDANITASGGSVGNLVFKTYGSERMRITSAGNVGIGTSAPQKLLHIVDATQTNQSIRFGTESAVPFGEINYTSSGEEFLTLSCKGTTAGFGNIVFKTGDTPTEKLRILAGGGITFNGDTAAANALDDYEEGTFTATLKGSTSDPTTPVTTTASYTKIGRQINVRFEFDNVNTTGALGDVSISGLPFTNSAVTTGQVMLYNFDFQTGTAPVAYLGLTNTIVLYANQDDSSWKSILHSAGTGRYMICSVTYFV
jgi:hypothetical protein